MRDPKIDPQPGDVVAKETDQPDISERTVKRRDGNSVFYTRNGGKLRSAVLASWQRWCWDAMVIEVAK